MERCLPQQIPVPQRCTELLPGARDAAAGIGRYRPAAGSWRALRRCFWALRPPSCSPAPPPPAQVSDPGALVRWGLPVSKAIHNVSLATVIGGLHFRRRHPAAGPPGAFPGQGRRTLPEHPAFTRALAVAAAAGAVWTLSAIAVLVLTYSDVAGQGLSGDPEFTRSLVYFMTDIEPGRAWLAVTHHRGRGNHRPVRRPVPRRTGGNPGAGMVGLVPAALIGHSSSSQ